MKKQIEEPAHYIIIFLYFSPNRRNLETPASFLRLDLPSTLISRENGAFRKPPAFKCGRKTIWNEAFGKDDFKIIMWFPWPNFPEHKSKIMIGEFKELRFQVPPFSGSIYATYKFNQTETNWWKTHFWHHCQEYSCKNTYFVYFYRK